jgi:hypothetical protein
MTRCTRPTSPSALAAAAGVAVFALIVVALHLVQQGHYHPLSQTISELALGRAGWLMAVAFCSIGIGTLLLALIIRGGPTKPRVAPALLAAAGLLSFVSAFVDADPSSGATTTHGEIHKLAGILTFVLIIVTMFLLARAFRRDPFWQRLATPTRAWALAALASSFLPSVSGDAYFGLAQRVMVAVSLSWMLITTLYAYRSDRCARAAIRTDARAPTPPKAQLIPCEPTIGLETQR